MEKILGNSVINEYRKNGAICLRRVFDQKWIYKVKCGIEKNLLEPSKFSESLKGEGDPGNYFNDYCNWTKIPEFEDYVFNSPAAEIAGILMESQYAAFYHEHVLVKEPGAFKKTPWHHDQSYYPIDGFKVCSIWMPVDPVAKINSLQLVAGSHLWKEWFYPRKFATSLNYIKESASDDKIYRDVPDIESNRNDYEILTWDVEPGDCIVFHMKTLHGAPGNSSENVKRRVLSTRWLGDDATMAARPWEVSPPIYGNLNIGDRAVSEEFPIVWTR
ncbi:probable phytanoyl-CoA dioxygenase [Centruroides vittatus]|uniref:probable phytanoyl-CoA dioxygenase n=1 Tax=Centruroides vittatus TaxID=120091 RepID=UPI00351099C3